ncbi:MULTISPECIES: DNA polymerase Y family protein [unclassified Ensifer]|uniref:Y-family DNA polymerase n=1 Tax=unclassified Ensifer TaxID=2633371 RepID=UPI001FCCD0A3|nr:MULTISPECIES: DNA polymerase Y family protein [unclassified Ensifer]
MARIRWGTSWLSRGRPDHPPVVFADRVRNAMRLVALDGLAEKSGFQLGQGVAEARAMCPEVDVLPADRAADRALLEGLADWCSRYTPLVALDGESGLYLDITGCAHLLGGEKSLLDDLLARLFHLGIEARAAISSSAGLSWAVARFGSQSVIAPEEAARVLAPLPMAALRLATETIETLGRVGLKQVGDIIEAPRAPLARRFGSTLLLRLDQAMGLEDEPLSPRLAVASLSAERRLSEPVQGEDDILGLTQELAARLKPELEKRGEGGRLFELLLFRVDGRVFRIAAGTSSPLIEPGRVAGLFRERLQAVHDDLDAGFGFEILRLSVPKSEKYEVMQEDFSGTPDRQRPLAAFADRVMARLGAESLFLPVLSESHVPERAAVFQPLADVEMLKTVEEAAPNVPASLLVASVRPQRLFQSPEPVEAVAEVPEGPPRSFRWRRSLHRIARAEGPERIAAEWWVDGETAAERDYFRVEDERGRRFWLFREGHYGGPTQPRWFMHGVFA